MCLRARANSHAAVIAGYTSTLFAGGADHDTDLAQAQPARDRDAEIAQLRTGVAKNDPKAMLDLYFEFNTFERGVTYRPQRITRAEAEAALRRAAELGYPDAMWRLAILLNRGSVVKRDAAGARLWAARAAANPPKGTRPADIQVQLGHWLSESDDADERKRGIEMLEALAGKVRGDAQANLALAIRASDPVRARKLLEIRAAHVSGPCAGAAVRHADQGRGWPEGRKTRGLEC